MKNNHESVANFIRQAIVACKEDYVMVETKRMLQRALYLVETVGDKRNSRATQSKFFEEEAKKKNEQWMKMLKDNLKPKFPEEQPDDKE